MRENDKNILQCKALVAFSKFPMNKRKIHIDSLLIFADLLSIKAKIFLKPVRAFQSVFSNIDKNPKSKIPQSSLEVLFLSSLCFGGLKRDGLTHILVVIFVIFVVLQLSAARLALINDRRKDNQSG